ncbi:MAG: hypothetical protein IPO87_16675 [Flavobacteriales bacterium]|nr:hypothetical protein [Flavobacteriales bacterium]
MSEEPSDHVQAEHDRHASEISLDELDLLFGLSVRAKNICHVNGLDTLADIAAYNTRFGGFKGLNSCGRLTDLELRDVILLAEMRIGLLREPKAEAHLQRTSALVMTDRDRMLADIRREFPRLSVRLRNVLDNFLEDTLPESILDKVLLSGLDIRKVRNAGVKSVEEFKEFKRLIIGGGPTPHSPSPIGPPAAQVFNVLRHHFDQDEAQLIIVQDILDDAAAVRILRLFRAMVGVWGQRKGARLNSVIAYTQYTPERGKLKQLAGQMELTRERVRQLISEWEDEFDARFAFTDELPRPFNLAPVELAGPAFIVTPSVTALINADLEVEWSQWFIAKVLGVISDKQYVHISWTKMGVPGPTARDLDATTPVLLRADSADSLTSMLAHFNDLLSMDRTNDSVHELSELSGGTALDVELSEAMGPLMGCLAEDVRFDEGRFYLRASKQKTREQVVAGELEELNAPTHVLTLVERLRVFDPERDWNEEAVRAVVVKAPTRFISFGRTSTYGLRTWEKERKEIKGGTIRSIVEDLLEKSDVPLHINHLTNAVRQYRPTTNASSIRTNLHLVEGGTFTFIRGGFIGLSSKTYLNTPDATNTVPGSFFRNSVMRKFIGRTLVSFKEHLRSNCSSDMDEIDRAVRAVVVDGRIVLDKNGVITGVLRVGSTQANSDLARGELPLDW